MINLALFGAGRKANFFNLEVTKAGKTHDLLHESPLNPVYVEVLTTKDNR